MNSDSIPRSSAFSKPSPGARGCGRRRALAARGLQVLGLAFLVAVSFPLLEAHAQATGKPAGGVRVIRAAQPVWLLEQDPDQGPLPTARTYGDSAFGEFHARATLAISCSPQSPTASLALQIAPSPLGFDSDPFEGPDATAHGPLRITAGARAALQRPVSGIWTDGGAFQVGTVFAINASIPRDELAAWASDASRGRPLKLSLAPAKAGGKPLTATFVLPQDNEGLKQVARSCVGAAAVKP